ncbi:MAG: tetratricopeptide repeat protein [Clostridiaceae bacterium]|nr:tetratricopeptide repeat protein [Clostridiaceae bacterium]
MFSISEELSNYQPIDLANIENKIGAIPEDIKMATELYNKALSEMGNKNEDIAIIALKKAISLYPDFYEAMNLLGLCYLSLGESDKAREQFSRVIKLDDSGLRANRYLNQLDGTSEDDVKKPSNTKRRSKPASNLLSKVATGLAPESKPNYYLKYIAGFVAGILVFLIVWLLLPGNKPLIIDFSGLLGKSAKYQAKIEELQKEILNYDNLLNETQTALKSADEKERQLQDRLDQFIVWTNNLRELDKLFYEGKYKEVVVQIEKNLSGLDMPDEIKKEIDAINEKAKPKSIGQFYESARSIYNSNSRAKDPAKYALAADEYRMAIKIIEELDEKPNYTAEIYYYGGKAIALSESPNKQQADEEAVSCFEKVISIAPRSTLANYARARINEIEEGIAIKH